MKLRISTLLFVSIITLTEIIPSARADGSACGNPKLPCLHPLKKFAPYELSFLLPKTIKPNTGYKSVPFYAVVLWSRPISDADECDNGESSARMEKERKAVQVLFPTRKVFAGQQCPDIGAVSYIVEGKTSTARLLAIYGGKGEVDAKSVLAKAKARYPEAAVRRVQAVFQRVMQ